MHKLSDLEVTKELQKLPGWEFQENAIARWFDRKSFQGSVAFVNTLMEIAERAEHHPDIDIRYNRVRVLLTTHDSGGVTDLDISLARQVSAAAD